jgi:hypothetical protein
MGIRINYVRRRQIVIFHTDGDCSRVCTSIGLHCTRLQAYLEVDSSHNVRAVMFAHGLELMAASRMEATVHR